MKTTDLLKLDGVPKCGHESRLGRCILDKAHSGGHVYPDRVAEQRRRRNRK